MSEDELFLQRRTIHYVEFGGIGGDIAAITITTESWRDLGSPETVKVTVAPESEDLEGYCRGCGDPASKHEGSFCVAHYSGDPS